MESVMMELAYRRAGGIEVTLWWHQPTGELAVAVADVPSGKWFRLPVAPAEALKVFYHPFAYAALRGIWYGGIARGTSSPGENAGIALARQHTRW